MVAIFIPHGGKPSTWRPPTNLQTRPLPVSTHIHSTTSRKMHSHPPTCSNVPPIAAFRLSQPSCHPSSIDSRPPPFCKMILAAALRQHPRNHCVLAIPSQPTPFRSSLVATAPLADLSRQPLFNSPHQPLRPRQSPLCHWSPAITLRWRRLGGGAARKDIL